jgi:ribosomal protein L7Ae-like RNA K-turn-binding protein
MLSNVVLANSSSFGANYDVAAVRAEEVSLVIIAGDFLTTTDWAGRL